MNAFDLMVSTIAGALVVISGGLYALLLAMSRLRNSRRLARLAAAAYLVLVIAALALAASLALAPVWYGLISVMLIGYWLAPQAIWHLTEATHVETDGGRG